MTSRARQAITKKPTKPKTVASSGEAKKERVEVSNQVIVDTAELSAAIAKLTASFERTLGQQEARHEEKMSKIFAAIERQNTLLAKLVDKVNPVVEYHGPDRPDSFNVSVFDENGARIDMVIDGKRKH